MLQGKKVSKYFAIGCIFTKFLQKHIEITAQDNTFILPLFISMHHLYWNYKSSTKFFSFLRAAKRKRGDKGKKERVSMQKLLKGCHQGQNIIVLAILERLEFKNFSCRPTMVTKNTFQCSMPSPPMFFNQL